MFDKGYFAKVSGINRGELGLQSGRLEFVAEEQGELKGLCRAIVGGN